jgi:hypothetical protein
MQRITSNRFTSPVNEDSETTPTPTGPTSNPKPPPSYNQNVTTIPPLIQLLDQTAHQQYVITALANNQVRVQPTTADSYRSITHTLMAKGAEFHTFKPKEERNHRVVLKHIHYSVNPDDIKSEIEKLGHKVANIWNIKQFQTKLPLSMFFVDLKLAPNNKDIFDVEFVQQCKIKFEPPKHKQEIAQCSNCQCYGMGTQKNYCHLQPCCVMCR